MFPQAENVCDTPPPRNILVGHALGCGLAVCLSARTGGYGWLFEVVTADFTEPISVLPEDN